MTDSAPAPDQTPATAAAPGMAATEGPANAPASAEGSPPPADATRDNARGRRKGAGPAGAAAPQADGQAKTPRAPRPIPPALEKLAELYPQLFGAVFLPLKRGIFQDFLAAHPDLFER